MSPVIIVRTLDLIVVAGMIAGVLLLGTLYLEARSELCAECARPFGIFRDTRCIRCWRRRRVVRLARRDR